MKLRTTLVAICLAMVSFTAHAGNVLWYQQPASKWMEAMPTGNGRLATMVYGGINRETVALNEISLWSGQPDSTNNDIGGRDKLDEIRRCFFNNDPEQGNKLGEKYFTGRGKSFGTHLPLGDLVIDFTYPAGRVRNYRRELDMDNAVAAVTFERGGVNYRREYITDYPDDVIAMRVTADKAGQCWEKATLGPTEPAAALYYNDAKPDKIFYQGLALLKLGRTAEANGRFHRLVNYGEKHLFDTVRMDYFAVSLPDLLIWEDDLQLRNEIHCKYMMALGYRGLGDRDKSDRYINEVASLDINHQGIQAFVSLMDMALA